MKFNIKYKETKAERTNNLSDNGSKNLPKEEIKLNFLAIYPSRASVIPPKIKINKAKNKNEGVSCTIKKNITYFLFNY